MILLKWHKRVTSPNHPSYVSYKVIGSIYGIDGSSVRRLILKRFGQLAAQVIQTRKQQKLASVIPLIKRYGYRFLSPEHLQFLCDPKVLTEWVGLTLKQRCIMFHRHFGNHRINPTLLRKVYQIHKIKKKRVKFVKHIDPIKQIEYEAWRMRLS